MSAVVKSKNIGDSENGENIDTSTVPPSSSVVPLIVVGNWLVSDGIVSMDMVGSCVSSVNDVDAVPMLPARSVTSTSTV